MPGFVDVPDGRMRYDLREGKPGVVPLLLIGGMTQTISSWGGQLRPLSATRTVVAYEARGQGATELPLDDASFDRHVEDAEQLIRALDLPTPLDVCGFSFGGRVALGLAAQRPALVRRLVLSGVGRGRTVLSRCIVEGWRAALATGDLECLARVSLSDILGPDYLEANATMVEPMVKAVMQRNSYEGISALFRDTLGRDGSDDGQGDPWRQDVLAGRVRAPTLVLAGAQDRIAPPGEVRALAAAMGAAHRIFDGAGHTVPIEAAEPWRRAVLAFLDANEPSVEATLSDGDRLH